MSPKSMVVVAAAVLSFAAGAATQQLDPLTGPGPGQVDLAHTILFALLIFAWYRLDSTQLGYRRSPWLNISVFGVALIALPYYFFRSRGAKGGLIATGLFLLTVVLSAVLTGLGSVAVAYGLQS